MGLRHLNKIDWIRRRRCPGLMADYIDISALFVIG
jgi:hypothetical protein